MKRILFLVLSLLFVLGACSTGDDPINESPSSPSTPTSPGNSGNNPGPTKDPVLLDSFVSFDYNTTTVSVCDTINGRYELLFNSQVPNIDKGNAIVVSNDTITLVVLVTDAKTSGNKVTMEGVLGDISYIFTNTEFTLQTDKNASTKSWNNVYFPEKAAKEGFPQTRWSESYSLWEHEAHYKTDIAKSSEYSIWTESSVSGQLNAKMTLQFSGTEENFINGIKFLKSHKVIVDACFYGEVTNSMSLNAQLHKKGKVKLHPDDEDDYALLKHNLFPSVQTKFMVSGVPVVILFNSDLYGQVDLTYDATLDYNTGISTVINGSIGTKFESESGQLTPYNSFEMSYDINLPELKGQGSIEGVVHVFPRIRALLYNVFGPSVDIKPYLKTKVGGTFNASIDETKDYIASYLKNYIGLDCAAGFSFANNIFGYETKNISTPDNNILEKQVYESPVNIAYEDTGKANVNGQTRAAFTDAQKSGSGYEVSFIVYDKDMSENEVKSPLSQIVKFETYDKDENLIANDNVPKYGMSVLGTVTTHWVPKIKPSTLVAKIYDTEGNVIASDKYSVEEEEEKSLRDILVKFYHDTNGDHWTHNDNWCSDSDISTWYGVYFWKGMLTLNLWNNNLSGFIDLSSCTALESLHCDGNRLTSLNVSGCTALKSLYCDRNGLTNLDVSGCSALYRLDIAGNTLTSLDISSCTALKSLDCIGNSLTSLDVSVCSALEKLWCQENLLTRLDVSGCIALQTLECRFNKLTNLDVSGFTALVYLSCYENQLSSLEISDCASLETLMCQDNQLTSLDVSGCTALKTLYCQDNQLTSLDVTSCTALGALDCSHNCINQEITSFYSNLPFFGYDQKYTNYREENGEWYWTTNDYGWWLPNETGHLHRR